MAEPLSLQHIARLICVQNLLDLTNGKGVTDYLKLAYHSAVTEDLLNHMVQFYPKKLTDEILAGLASPHIQNLRLVNCTRIKPSKFIKIVPYCKKLHGLDLKKCNQMMLPDFFVLIKMAGFHLTSLCVEDCTTVDDSVVHSILKNLPGLRHLNVSSCNNITDGAFLLDKDQHKRRKHALENGGSTEVDLYPVSLTSIDVSGCRVLTNLAVHNLATLTGPTLQHVCLSWTKLTLECLLCLAGLDVPRSFLGDDDEFEATEESALSVHSEDAEKVSENRNPEELSDQADDGSHSPSEVIVLPSDGCEKTFSASQSADLRTENGGQWTVSSDATSGISPQDGSVYPNGCDKDDDQSVLAAEGDSDSVHTCKNGCDKDDDQSVLAAEGDSDSVHTCKNGCDKDDDQSVLAAEGDSDSVHTCRSEHGFDQSVLAAEGDSDSVHTCRSEHKAVLTAVSDSNDVRNTLDKYPEQSTSETPEYMGSSRNTASPLYSQSVQQLYENGMSIEHVENSESQITPVKDCTNDKYQYTVQSDGLSNFRSETHLSEDKNVPCSSNHEPLDLSLSSSSETKALNMFESCNPCSLLKYDSSKTCSLDQIDIVLNERLDSLNLCNINETPNGNDKDEISKTPDTIDEKQSSELMIKDQLVCAGYATESSNVQNSENLETYAIADVKPESLDEGKLNPDHQNIVLNLVQCSLDHASTSQSIWSEENIKTNVEKVENHVIHPSNKENMLSPSPQLDRFVESQSSTECEELVLPLNDAVCFDGNLQGNISFSQPFEHTVNASSQSEGSSECTNVVPNELSKTLTKDSRSKLVLSRNEKESLPTMKKFYTPIIRSIDLEELVHPNNKQKVLEDALGTFITENPSLQTFKLSWPLLPNYLLKHLVDKCADLRELTLVGCHVIDAEHIRYVGSQCRKLTKLELEDVRRLTDWSVVPAVSNTEIETLSLKETDIHDVTAVRMAANLAENLKSLDISYCQELTERGINAFLRKKSLMTSFSIRQGALSDLSLGLLCDNFWQLRSVNLASVKFITGSGLISLAKNLRHLDYIDLSWASGSSLQDDVIQAFLTHCKRLNQMVLSGQSLLTSASFLPIISDYPKWSRCKALFFLKAKERELEATIGAEEETDSSDDEYEALCFPHRSTTFATHLQHLSLEYCDSITDSDMEDIVTVCRGSLSVIDYYSWEVKPRLLRLNKFKIQRFADQDAEIDSP